MPLWPFLSSVHVRLTSEPPLPNRPYFSVTVVALQVHMSREDMMITTDNTDNSNLRVGLVNLGGAR